LFKSRQFAIGIAVSLIFLAWALWNEDPAKVWSALLQAEHWSLFPALGLYFLGVIVRAVRWRILLQPIVPQMKLNKTFEIVAIGYMANNVLPARIGELVRAYVVSRREGVRKTATLATIFVERIFDGLTMLGFAAAVVTFLLIADRDALQVGEGHKLGSFLADNSVTIVFGAVAFLGLLAAFMVVASSQRRVWQLIAFGLRFLPGRLHERAQRLASSFIEGLGSLRNVSTLGIVFGLSIIAWLFETGMYYVIGTWGFGLVGNEGLGGPLPFHAYMLATAFANLGTLIPQGPGYIGVFEVIIKIVLVGAFGALTDQATSYAVLLHATLLVPITVLGFVYLWREGLSWRDLAGLEKTRAKASEQAHEMEGPLTDIELVQEGKISEGEAEVELERAGEGGPTSTGSAKAEIVLEQMGEAPRGSDGR
jgi:glycosyltransferase 2 family protein